MKTALRILAIIAPVGSQLIFTRFYHLADPIEAILWVLAFALTVVLLVYFAATAGSGPCLVVRGESWATWDFRAREHGPKIPPGTWDILIIRSPTTERATVVLDNPEDFGLNPADLVGQDEENLREAIATGQTNMKLVI